MSTTFAALADPTRRAILARLADGEATVNELAEPFEMSLPRRLLASEGVRARRVNRARPRGAVAAQLAGGRGPLREVADWVENYRQYWEESFDRLDEYLSSSRPPPNDQTEEGGEESNDHKKEPCHGGRRAGARHYCVIPTRRASSCSGLVGA